MTKLHERLRKVEAARVKPSTRKQLVAWKDMDGSYRHGGETWDSIESIRAAYPKEFDPGPALVFKWSGGAE